MLRLVSIYYNGYYLWSICIPGCHSFSVLMSVCIEKETQPWIKLDLQKHVKRTVCSGLGKIHFKQHLTYFIFIQKHEII